jgi:hypothetical protein
MAGAFSGLLAFAIEKMDGVAGTSILPQLSLPPIILHPF